MAVPSRPMPMCCSICRVVKRSLPKLMLERRRMGSVLQCCMLRGLVCALFKLAHQWRSLLLWMLQVSRMLLRH